MKFSPSSYLAYFIYILSFFYLLNAEAHANCQIAPQAKLVLLYNGFVPTVSAAVNGQPIKMGIDTGAQRSVVSPELAARLHLPSDPHRYTSVYSTSSHHEVVADTLIDSLSFAGTNHSHISLPTVSLKLPTIGNSPSPDETMEGLIGADILSQYDLEFDFPNKRLTLYHVSDCYAFTPPWQGQYMTLPMLTTISHRPTLQLELDGHLVTAIFDTGSHGTELSPSAATRIGLTKEILAKDPLHNGAGVNGSLYKVPSHTFAHVKIGTQTYNNIMMDVVDLGSTEADAILGENYMISRHFWLSYATQTLYIQ